MITNSVKRNSTTNSPAVSARENSDDDQDSSSSLFGTVTTGNAMATPRTEHASRSSGAHTSESSMYFITEEEDLQTKQPQECASIIAEMDITQAGSTLKSLTRQKSLDILYAMHSSQKFAQPLIKIASRYARLLDADDDFDAANQVMQIVYTTMETTNLYLNRDILSLVDFATETLSKAHFVDKVLIKAYIALSENNQGAAALHFLYVGEAAVANGNIDRAKFAYEKAKKLLLETGNEFGVQLVQAKLEEFNGNKTKAIELPTQAKADVPENFMIAAQGRHQDEYNSLIAASTEFTARGLNGLALSGLFRAMRCPEISQKQHADAVKKIKQILISNDFISPDTYKPLTEMIGQQTIGQAFLHFICDGNKSLNEVLRVAKTINTPEELLENMGYDKTFSGRVPDSGELREQNFIDAFTKWLQTTPGKTLADYLNQKVTANMIFEAQGDWIVATAMYEPMNISSTGDYGTELIMRTYSDELKEVLHRFFIDDVVKTNVSEEVFAQYCQ